MFDNVINTYQNKYNEVKERLFPNNRIVLVGGCLRDTFYGVEVKDLDFVVEVPALEAMPFSPWDFNHQMVFMELFNGQRAQYVEMDNLWGYLNQDNGIIDVVESSNKDVNFIFVRDIPTYTKNFPDSISKMVFDGETIHVSRDWELGNENNWIYMKHDIKPERKEKLINKYPNKTVIQLQEGEVFFDPRNQHNPAVPDLLQLAEAW